MPVNIYVGSELEKLLLKSRSKTAKFPHRSGQYYANYLVIKQYLADKYYSVAASGLATNGDRYTKHDIGHVDDVITTAGHMLGFDTDPIAASKLLEPYEVFVLLVAILLHDAGNAVAREGHEQKAGEILREVAVAANLTALEQRMIASIAQAHGGEMEDGNKDTITELIVDPVPSIGNVKVRARLLAALLRLADELSENPTRADQVAIDKPDTPDISLLANLYCKSINTKIDHAGKSITLAYDIEMELLPRVFKVQTKQGGTSEVMFIDYVADRLEKCERERRYCNRFLVGAAGYDRIRASLVVIRDHREVDRVAVDLEEGGYPGLTMRVKQLEPQFDGCVMRDKHCSPIQEE
ncbi:putative HD superfamily hydrolase [Agrobacterium sp. DSM 25558]|uniref:HD domain-containing protein n=1 Tax=Agrobacterium sp. DSM 25558 TaxID=1907665 RepID=UPI00097260E1|nr:hypothetical protein [Agrobacterium sp. DSM 25558]SCX32366.1 putative HD superfamily hydrolase [Agrobacterium sp. DSM 25558]